MEWYCFSCGNVFTATNRVRCPECRGTKCDLVPDCQDELDAAAEIYDRILSGEMLSAVRPSTQGA